MKAAIKNYFNSFGIFCPVIKTVMFSVILGATVFIVDYYNFVTKAIHQVPSAVMWVVGITLAILLVCWFLHMHLHELFFIASTNLFDILFMVLFLSTFVYGVFNGIWLHSRYLLPSLAIGLFFFILTIARVCFHFFAQKQGECSGSSVFDLKSIYENTFNYTGKGPILIEEAEVEYDLLNRSHIINWIVYSIRNCKSAQSFVIGLEGPWGSGKTTIINNVKHILNSESQSLYIIDDFDPWYFGTEEALLWGMYDAIFKSSGTKYSVLRSHKMIEQLSTAVVDKNTVGRIIKPIAFDYRNGIESLGEIKNKISAYLRTRDQTIVFFIDNIDRAEGKNIIFLFKLIGTIFSLPKVVYVLSYDRERVNKVFNATSDVDAHYIEKIIQQEIKVPIITDEQIKVLYSRCIENLLLAYGVKKDDIPAFMPLSKYICASIRDLRQFKRLINSAFSTAFYTQTNLYKLDLLVLETVRFIRPNLYFEIYKNRKYFISHDIMLDEETQQYLFDENEFNEQGKVFFDSLFSLDTAAKELLAEIFPYVERYKHKEQLKNSFQNREEEYHNISSNKRVCSAKYFDLYFSCSSNNYVRINEDVAEFINKIAELDNFYLVKKALKDVLAQISPYDQKEWFEQLQIRIDTPKSAYYLLSKALFDFIYEIDNSWAFLSLDARQRCIVIIVQILRSCADDEFDDFLSIISDEFGKIGIISNLVRWIEKKDGETILSSRRDDMEQVYGSLCEKVLKNGIDLYDDNYYHAGNIYGLYHYCKDKFPERFKDYISSVLSEKNVYRILWDITSCRIGSQYLYQIDEESIEEFFGDDYYAEIESILQCQDPKSSSEKFVKEIYMTFRYGKANSMGEESVVTNKEVKPFL